MRSVELRWSGRLGFLQPNSGEFLLCVVVRLWFVVEVEAVEAMKVEAWWFDGVKKRW